MSHAGKVFAVVLLVALVPAVAPVVETFSGSCQSEFSLTLPQTD